MNELQYQEELSKCVRCGACKAHCPTYLSVLNETMGARGRIAMLDGVRENLLAPTKGLTDKIFSCILCEACRDLCPTGINIPETIYHGRIKLKDLYSRGHLLRKGVEFSLPRIETVFFILRWLQKFFYPLLYKTGRIRYMPEIAPVPFKDTAQVYKNTGLRNNSPSRKIGRVAVFTGCSINYFYPHLGNSLLKILLTKGYEIVVLKGEVCCGAPLRSLGLEEEASLLARKNIELFNKLRVGAIISMCPTCTMTIKKQYPLFVGDSIEKIMDVTEFLLKNELANGLKTNGRVITYHDPCHLSYGLGIKKEPRELLGKIQGLDLVEMQNSEECCGFGGFFSVSFKDLSRRIGEKKIKNILNTSADTVVTSCPGCMTQLEDMKRTSDTDIDIMHIVEVIDEAMHG